MQTAVQEIPSKFVSTEIEIQLACRLLFIDMEGLNDGRAVKTIVPQVNPRKMVRKFRSEQDCIAQCLQILVHASMDAAKALIESCAQIRAMTKDIYAPETGESTQIGQQSNSFSISLSDELLSTLKMSRVRNIPCGSWTTLHAHQPAIDSLKTMRLVT